MKSVLDSEAQNKLERIPEEYRKKWGENGIWNPFNSKYNNKTIVKSGDEALEAFKYYTDYFEYVCDNWKKSSNTLVLVPCGSSKPIGSSTIHQKKINAIRDGGLKNADIVIISEPCTVVPPKYRLSIPAINYDFPPEFTDKKSHPEVFDLFTDRLAEWLDSMNYETIYPFLIKGHMNKFNVAVEKMERDPDVHSIPSASYNPDTGSYSGDRFKSQEDMIEKVKAVLKYKSQKKISHPEEYSDFYSDKFSPYQE